MTPIPLARYRERHVIEPVKDWLEDIQGFVWRCKHDRLRIYPRTGGWRHASEEILGLVALERGQTIQW
jgi:hypothetical protein